MLRERDHPAPSAPLDLDWMLFAACSELEVEESDRLFFFGLGQSRLANQARAICAGCGVQGECLEFALRNPDETEFGVWGGATPSQRRRLRGLARWIAKGKPVARSLRK
jgi:WhiB family transcriptional regulator, redox-sensing transcriptional regulator